MEKSIDIIAREKAVSNPNSSKSHDFISSIPLFRPLISDRIET
jgi:hypothetical protein